MNGLTLTHLIQRDRIEHTIRRQAGELSLRWRAWASAPRRSPPRVPDDVRIYAIGDVHGRADLLQRLLSVIDRTLVSHPVKNVVQVLLGDYIDRGPNSREVIETLVTRARRQPMIYLKGNHESYAAQFLRNPSILTEWQRLGGVNTLLSYGLKAPKDEDPTVQQRIATEFRKALPESHRRFIRLALSYTCGDFFFAHAGVRPGIPLSRQCEQDLLWIRDDFLLHEEQFGKVVVHGHTPSKTPDVRANRINIDTGAYATGRLTCLVLQGDRIAVI
jgi:serine/threonine protein phosphatase 1